MDKNKQSTARYFILDANGNPCPAADDRATHALIPVGEHKGLLAAADIVRRRALQQIVEPEPDEHGYTLLSSEVRRYGQGKGSAPALYLIKRTPHSCLLPTQQAEDLVRLDLVHFYNYVNPREAGVPADWIAKAAADPGAWDGKNFMVEPNDAGRRLREVWDRHGGRVTFGVAGFRRDFKRGVLEVRCWATCEF